MEVCSLNILPIQCYSSVTPDQWASFSDENILKTEQECNASATLRGVIDGVLDQTKQDAERQRVTVNLVFEQRIQETAEAKQSLEEHLEKVGPCASSHTFSCFIEVFHAAIAVPELSGSLNQFT